MPGSAGRSRSGLAAIDGGHTRWRYGSRRGFDIGRFKSWRQPINHAESRQIRKGAGRKQRVVIAARKLQDVTDPGGSGHVADRTTHPANSDHGADRAPRKHIGCKRVEICGPALVGRRRKTDQADGRPQIVNPGRQNHRDDAERADTASPSCALIEAPPALERERRSIRRRCCRHPRRHR